ncbi:hypothetical protein [Aureibacter tunicatorum]|uniref:Uncharacterized protein n=1 Tax=Aureibacter tunicatorum TaxID=866807 RepID=A0AAE3XS07_9BACT|nr:hypothetical protein [Aureibacter tunicatorum]MDR6241490.1 hypothetical protein [Aureibacter tunicatorum]BDD06667.1 hypothetical protein AUTU_41500 [Aureibacter tunicatorum]
MAADTIVLFENKNYNFNLLDKLSKLSINENYLANFNVTNFKDFGWKRIKNNTMSYYDFKNKIDDLLLIEKYGDYIILKTPISYLGLSCDKKLQKIITDLSVSFCRLFQVKECVISNDYDLFYINLNAENINCIEYSGSFTDDLSELVIINENEVLFYKSFLFKINDLTF